MTLDEWNERYRSGSFDETPATLLVRAVSHLPAGRALDLACGAGRNALWLASQGWDVVAIDGATEAIRIVRERNAAIDARVIDLENAGPLSFDDESFDLVAILYYLHRPLFAEAKRVVKRGGKVVCAVKMTGTYRVEPGELTRYFEDFEVLRWSEGEIAEIVARRP